MEESIKFHGHLCPMSYLGVRMGKVALKRLGRAREKGVRLIAVVEFKNCLADGIQLVTGATYGKNTLFLKDHGKFAASFYDLVSEKSVRIRVRNEIIEGCLVYGMEAQDVKALPPDNRKEAAARILEKGKEITGRLEKMGDADLFTIVEAPYFDPEKESSLKPTVCEDCNELVLKEFISEQKGKIVCRDCRDRL
jgi:formylmethanofuran dehydrogenase subunit E